MKACCGSRDLWSAAASVVLAAPWSIGVPTAPVIMSSATRVLFFYEPHSLGWFGGGGGVYRAREPIHVVNFLISPDFHCKKFSGPRRGGGGVKWPE
jgi:hypothetical protein